jgi:putative transposase
MEPNHPKIPVSRQCELVGISRSGWYYQPGGESAENLKYMRLIDEEYTHTPFYGVRRMTAWLRRQGYEVNHKRVGRLMRVMGLETIYPKPRLSCGGPESRKYPYLLGNLVIARPNHVWSTDITYIRLRHGFVYLTAILDWFSRYVLAWELSDRLEVGFCLVALEKALQGSQPEIFNSDQGTQFTSLEFTGRLEAEGIRISMDGRGRVFDNIFIERLWRSVKYEEVYLKDYASVSDCRESLQNYFRFYNEERLHQALDYQTPQAMYWTGGQRAA